MKIREGFVSNSSSTSFIIGFDERKILTSPREIYRYLKEDLGADITILGMKLSEGFDIFKLEGDIKTHFVENHKDYLGAEFVGLLDAKVIYRADDVIGTGLDMVYGHFYEYDSYKVKNEVKKDDCLLNIDRDEHFTKNVEEFIKRYK